MAEANKISYDQTLAVLACFKLIALPLDKSEVSKRVFYKHHKDLSDENLDVIFCDLIDRGLIKAKRQKAKLIYVLTDQGIKTINKLTKSSVDELATCWRLADMRNEFALSQKDFAEKLNISWRTYQNYESGHREVRTSFLRALHRVFNVNPLWLLSGEGSMISPESK